MWKHAKNEHPNDPESVTFDMKVKGVFNKALRRQISEAISILNKKKEENLNSKSEFNGPSVKRRTIEGLMMFCNKCEYRCKSDIGLKKHKMSMHVTHETQFKCDNCGDDFDSVTNLRRHTETIHRANQTKQHNLNVTTVVMTSILWQT